MVLLFVGLYLSVGVVLAVVALRRGSSWIHVALVVPMWPMMAPSLLGARASFPAPPHLGELELAALSPAERDAVHRFQRHLSARLAQLEALHRLRRQSKGRITERLDQVEAELNRDLEGGRALLEELADRVALAQVAALGLGESGAPDRLRLETLIARADALVQETSDSFAPASPPLTPWRESGASPDGGPPPASGR